MARWTPGRLHGGRRRRLFELPQIVGELLAQKALSGGTFTIRREPERETAGEIRRDRCLSI
jgi:hypothetical protein